MRERERSRVFLFYTCVSLSLGVSACREQCLPFAQALESKDVVLGIQRIPRGASTIHEAYCTHALLPICINDCGQKGSIEGGGAHKV